MIPARLIRCLALALLLPAAAAGQTAQQFTEMRELLASAIEKTVNLARSRTGQPAIDPRIIAAMRKVPRHEFAPEALRPYAYLDRPLTVGQDATISQPSLIAVMTELLRLEAGDKVLEVGTGGAYHSAILAELAREVFSVEFHKEIAEAARATLTRLGYGGIRVNVADGYYGWRPAAPYDAILVRMAVPDVSSALIAQLKPGGRLIAPVGPEGGPQVLVLFQKDEDGRVREAPVMPVIFRALPGGMRL